MVLREGARCARNALLGKGPDSLASKLILVRAMSRAVWRQDRRLASRLLRCPLAREHIEVRENDRVALRGPARFSFALDELQVADARGRLSSVRSALGAASRLPSLGA
eukprot:9332422-Pyramimonas_sp.AAC.1